MRRKEERSKQGQTNKQGKATQHTQGSEKTASGVTVHVHVHEQSRTCIHVYRNTFQIYCRKKERSSIECYMYMSMYIVYVYYYMYMCVSSLCMCVCAVAARCAPAVTSCAECVWMSTSSTSTSSVWTAPSSSQSLAHADCVLSVVHVGRVPPEAAHFS